MDACLSFSTVSIFTDTNTYTDHGHGRQITDLWMARFSLLNRPNLGESFVCKLLMWSLKDKSVSITTPNNLVEVHDGNMA